MHLSIWTCYQYHGHHLPYSWSKMIPVCPAHILPILLYTSLCKACPPYDWPSSTHTSYIHGLSPGLIAAFFKQCGISYLTIVSNQPIWPAWLQAHLPVDTWHPASSLKLHNAFLPIIPVGPKWGYKSFSYPSAALPGFSGNCANASKPVSDRRTSLNTGRFPRKGVQRDLAMSFESSLFHKPNIKPKTKPNVSWS